MELALNKGQFIDASGLGGAQMLNGAIFIRCNVCFTRVNVGRQYNTWLYMICLCGFRNKV